MKSKIIILLLSLVLHFGTYAQFSKNLSISVSSGISMPTGEYAKYVKPNDTVNAFGDKYKGYGFTQTTTQKLQFNIDAAYNFGAFGMGISLGKFNHQISTNEYNLDFPTTLEGGAISGSYYGVGPQYGFSLGKLKMTTMIRAGSVNFAMPDDFKVIYEFESASTTKNIRELHFEDTSLVYASTGVKIAYPLGKHLEIFTKVDYFTTFGDGILFQEEFYFPIDYRDDNAIDEFEVSHFTTEELLQKEDYFIKPGMLNIGAGITYKIPLGLPKIPKKTTTTRLNNNPKEDKKEQKETQIVLTYPDNGAQFSNDKPLKKLSWKIVGESFRNPIYIIEVRSIGKEARTYIGQSQNTSISAKELFKGAELSGQYSWKVVERNTGITSMPKSFNYTNCDIDMQITNVTSECLGYVGADRKFKICFDVTYDSPVGDLTYNNSGSGLSVYDQNYAALSYTLTGTNTTLQTQIGASTTTVHYCFETTVDNNVNQIGFGLQGDDLDPGPITCQPGVSNGVDELPSCLCDECEKTEITADGFSITTNAQNPSVFTFDGNINVNVPIYGIEFQVLSIDYVSNPGACSNGVTNVETSGIFLQNGTTINNSSSIQFFNESASTSGNSNNNASRDIKYMSSSAMTGNIPVNLNVGLPQPLQGLDAGCCQIDYTVCMKVIVYYEDGTCKTCQITKCFNFNNQ